MLNKRSPILFLIIVALLAAVATSIYSPTAKAEGSGTAAYPPYTLVGDCSRFYAMNDGTTNLGVDGVHLGSNAAGVDETCTIQFSTPVDSGDITLWWWASNPGEQWTLSFDGNLVYTNPATDVNMHSRTFTPGTSVIDMTLFHPFTNENGSVFTMCSADSCVNLSDGTVVPALFPTISSIVPNSGPVAGGTSVIITGTNLTGGTVTFDGLSASCTVDSDTQITCSTPAHAAGLVDVVVTTPDGSYSFTEGFTYTTATTPTVTTDAASAVSISGATLNGTVNANGDSTTVTFEYGLTTSYGSTVTADQSPVIGSTDTAVSAAISGLAADTIYHYRAVGTNSGGTTNGANMTFTTSGATVGTPIDVNVCPPGTSDFTSSTFSIPPSGSAWTDVDVMYLFDTSSSMGGVLGSATAGSTDIMNNVKATFPTAQFGVSQYSDYLDPNPPNPYLLNQQLTTSTGDVTAAVTALIAADGGDIPEDAIAGFDASLGLPWRGGTVGKFVVLFTDAPAHDPDPVTTRTLTQAMVDFNAAGITLLVVNSGDATNGTYWEGWATQSGAASEVIDYVTETFVDDVTGLILGASSRILAWELSDSAYNSWVSSVPTEHNIGGAGGDYSFDMTLTVPSGEMGTHNFTINYTLDSVLQETQDVTISTTCPVTMALTKTAEDVNGAPLYVDDVIRYTINITNENPVAMTNVVVTDTLPAGVTFDAATPAGYSGPNPLVWDVGTLTPGMNWTAVITVHVDGTANPIGGNIASVNSDQQEEESTEPVLPPGGGDITLTADLAISQSISNDFLDTIFSIVVQNDGPDAAPGAVVSATFPVEITNITWTCAGSGGATCPASGSGNTINDTLGSFPNGGVVTYTVTTRVNDNQVYTNAAEVIPPAGVIDPDMLNNYSEQDTAYLIILPIILNNASLTP